MSRKSKFPAGEGKVETTQDVLQLITDHLFVALLVNVLSLSAFLLLLSMSKSTLIVFFPPANRSDLGATV